MKYPVNLQGFEGQTIELQTQLVGRASNQFATGNIEVTDERQPTMPDVFKLTPLYLAWAHWQARMFAFHSLNTGHFIQAFRVLTLLCSFERLLVDCVDVGNFFIKVCFVLRCQPVAAQVRLDVSLF